LENDNGDERVAVLQEAMRRTFKDPEFHKEFKKLTGDVPTPLMPETMEKYIRELPRSRVRSFPSFIKSQAQGLSPCGRYKFKETYKDPGFHTLKEER
jgi:hypothetical protein